MTLKIFPFFEKSFTIKVINFSIYSVFTLFAAQKMHSPITMLIVFLFFFFFFVFPKEEPKRQPGSPMTMFDVYYIYIWYRSKK